MQTGKEWLNYPNSQKHVSDKCNVTRWRIIMFNILVNKRLTARNRKVLSEPGFESTPPEETATCSSSRSDRTTFRSVGGWRPIKSAAPTFPHQSPSRSSNIWPITTEKCWAEPSGAEKICGNLRRFRSGVWGVTTSETASIYTFITLLHTLKLYIYKNFTCCVKLQDRHVAFWALLLTFMFPMKEC